MTNQTSFLAGVSESGSVSLRSFQQVADTVVLDAPTSQAPFVKGSETSEAAAKKISRGLNEKQGMVYLRIRSFGERGQTDAELTDYFVGVGWSPNTARPRRIELRDRGLIVDSGRRRDGSTVWVTAAQQAQQAQTEEKAA
ncbi:MAG TPA: hypothetical protein VD948_06605 [Rhodothermales bacterium]|nr:hypothetical protein [Rhodothermales bacterium]